MKLQHLFALCISGFFLVAALNARAEEKPDATPPRKPVDVHFVDGSSMKMQIETDEYELVTAYGKLTIPSRDIRVIELASRVPDEIVKQVEEAIASLSSPQYEIRENAASNLLKIGAKAYPALLAAQKSKDFEAATRLEDVIDKVRAGMTGSQVETRQYDVVHTSHSRISGTLNFKLVKATSAQFGSVEMNLADIRDLRFEPGEEEVDLAKVESGPPNLYGHIREVGKTFAFKVTGNAAGIVWGTDIYTADSSLAIAAVHAGVLKNGQTGIVRLKMVDSPASFNGSVRNGITSHDYGSFSGAYKILRAP